MNPSIDINGRIAGRLALRERTWGLLLLLFTFPVNAQQSPNTSPAPPSIPIGDVAYYQPILLSVPSRGGFAGRRHFVSRATFTPYDQDAITLDRSRPVQARLSNRFPFTRLEFEKLGELQFAVDGRIGGKLRNGEGEDRLYGGLLELEVTVMDTKLTRVEKGVVEQVRVPGWILKKRDELDKAQPEEDLELFVYYYHETPTEGKEAGAKSAHAAARYLLQLRVHQQAIPYIPHEQPLKLDLLKSWEAYVGHPFHTLLDITGGIEPYEILMTGLPDGLEWNSAKRTFEGAPNGAGRFTVQIEVKDAQTPSGHWGVARTASEDAGKPYRSATATLLVRPQLDARLVLPRFSRVGSEAEAFCIASGGLGRPRFTLLELTKTTVDPASEEPTIDSAAEQPKEPQTPSIDPDSGILSFEPTKKGVYRVVVEVLSFDSAMEEAAKVVKEGTWQVIDPLPEPGIR